MRVTYNCKMLILGLQVFSKDWGATADRKTVGLMLLVFRGVSIVSLPVTAQFSLVSSPPPSHTSPILTLLATGLERTHHHRFSPYGHPDPHPTLGTRTPNAQHPAPASARRRLEDAQYDGVYRVREGVGCGPAEGRGGQSSCCAEAEGVGGGSRSGP